MQRLDIDVDGFEHDPGHWGASLASNAELVLGSLEAAGVRSVAEVGAYAGDFTRVLLQWGERRGVAVTAIDPAPQPALERLAEQHEQLDLIRATSHEALAEMELPEAVILDGDHNYFTVANELRIIAERAGDERLPLILFHDVCWPHGRRDTYEAPDTIPAEHRQPLVRGGGLYPGDPGIRPGGLIMWASARTEGGQRNGVLTAIEDFLADREDVRLVVVPAFFGLGVLWSLSAPYADALAELLDPWDRNPLLERMEANRVLHLANSHVQLIEAATWQQRDQRKVEFLRKLLESKAFHVGQLVSRLRQRGEPAFSKAEIRALVDDR